MGSSGRIVEFRLDGNDWFCNAGLPSDVTVVVKDVNFHLHKFPLVSRCGKMDKEIRSSQKLNSHTPSVHLEDFPGGPDNFLIIAKFCYNLRIELTPINIITIYSAADYLEMTDELGEDNLLSRCNTFFHKNILRNWKDCIISLQSAEPVISYDENLKIIDKCLNALCTLVCTDPSLFGWPMLMYGSLQSPGGSILWNGINTGARIRSAESDWWYEDISCLCINIFEKLIKKMKTRGIRAESIAGVIMYYTQKYIPVWRRTSGNLSSTLTNSIADQKSLIETIVKLLPEKKDGSYCSFLLGLLRTGLILGVGVECKDMLEKRIGMQLEFANIDEILIPSYSDCETLYDVDCVQRIVDHFVSSDSRIPVFSPCSPETEELLMSEPLRKAGKLVDNYLVEVASDVSLKPDKFLALAEALPEDSRSLHDGLYRALDIYFKAHPKLSDTEKEQLCNILDYPKLSIDACAHASQNERLPLRIVLQILFFEQMHLRTAINSHLHISHPETISPNPNTPENEIQGEIIQKDGWVSVVQNNHGLKEDMEKMRIRVRDLEQEFGKIKQEVRKVSKSRSSISFSTWKIGCNLRPRSLKDAVKSGEQTSRVSVDRSQDSGRLRHRKSVSVLQ